jgi:CRP-like cAMP-binding protein
VGNTFYIIIDGACRVSINLPDGKEKEVGRGRSSGSSSSDGGGGDTTTGMPGGQGGGRGYDCC